PSGLPAGPQEGLRAGEPAETSENGVSRIPVAGTGAAPAGTAAPAGPSIESLLSPETLATLASLPAAGPLPATSTLPAATPSAGTPQLVRAVPTDSAAATPGAAPGTATVSKARKALMLGASAAGVVGLAVLLYACSIHAIPG